MSEAQYAGAVIGHNFGEFSALSTDLTANPQAGTELHRCADALLTDLAIGTVPAGMPAGFADTSDHWLAPAIEALVLLMRGEEALEPWPAPPSATSDGPRSSSASPWPSPARATASTPPGSAAPLGTCPWTAR